MSVRWDGKFLAAVLLAAALFATPGAAGAQDARAGAPPLAFPVACTPGEDCWYFAYVDLDSGTGYRDYRCGLRSYEGHRGTDIAPRDPAASPAVVAAAGGRVVATRDGLDDAPMTVREEARVATKCGNGVRIDHGGGWITQYCHLARGSVAVRDGDRVRAGDALGRIGSSGWSELPHLHFQLEHDGDFVDPFSGRVPSTAAGCVAGQAAAGRKAETLWQDPRRAGRDTYREIVFFRVGLTDAVPEAARARGSGYPDAARVDAAALVAYAVVLGAPAGMRIETTITGPAGAVVHEGEKRLERDYARYFAYSGTKRKVARWSAGTYRARLTLSGEGATGPYSETRETHLELR